MEGRFLEQMFSPKGESKKETRDFESKRLLEALISDDFLKALKLTGEETAKTGAETGFNLILRDEETYVDNVSKGGLDRMSYSIDGCDFFSEDFEEHHQHPKDRTLLDFHFHPNEDEFIAPSDSDLLMLSCPEVSFLSVGRIVRGRIEILMIRKKRNVSHFEIMDFKEEYAKEIERGFFHSQEGIQDILERNGFESFLISYVKEKGKYRLAKKSEDVILGIKDIKILK